MDTIGSIDNLKVYRKAMALGSRVWNAFAHRLDYDEKVLASQLIRATDSIAANIAEGFGRYSYRERIRFLHIARGSLQETSTWLTKARQREFLPCTEFDILHSDLLCLQRMLNSYIASLKRKL